ncbi:MAG: preprotein translocase subunit SecG [Ardenticatenaceae bacterium]|nr:preprotein translocase subunit SecG [Ardenticatenaceae bacterium]
MALDLQAFAPWLSAIELILSIVLTVLVVLQSRGSDLSSFMGGDSGGSFRTKRGIEAVMHQWTIYLSIVFFIVTLLTFISLGQAS